MESNGKEYQVVWLNEVWIKEGIYLDLIGVLLDSVIFSESNIGSSLNKLVPTMTRNYSSSIRNTIHIPGFILNDKESWVFWARKI